jgi:hypothetical protein
MVVRCPNGHENPDGQAYCGQCAAPVTSPSCSATQAARPRQPGWYDDPNDANAQRYWDGQDWTPQRQRKLNSQPSIAPVTATQLPPLVTAPNLAWPKRPTPQPAPKAGMSTAAIVVTVFLTVVVVIVTAAAIFMHFNPMSRYSRLEQGYLDRLHDPAIQATPWRMTDQQLVDWGHQSCNAVKEDQSRTLAYLEQQGSSPGNSRLSQTGAVVDEVLIRVGHFISCIWGGWLTSLVDPSVRQTPLYAPVLSNTQWWRAVAP